MKLQDMKVKRCLTSSGWLVQDSKILLVKHKMLGLWLAPGGHVDENELPHHAAEREFLEETGIKVRAVSAYPLLKDVHTENLPLPFNYNLHWINKPGEHKKNPHSGRICEQHFVFAFFVEPVDSLKITNEDIGIDAVDWFSREQIPSLQTSPDIVHEIYFALDHYPTKVKK